MEHPFFFEPKLPMGEEPFQLDEESARHIITVLRMRNGDRLLLTDGQGGLVEVEMVTAEKKKAFVQPVTRQLSTVNAHPPTVNRQPSTLRPQSLVLAVSLLKNSSRFEWILEKATEIGVSAIIPLICDRTERIAFRRDRLQQIVISAMLQSQQVWLPELSEPVPFRSCIAEKFDGLSYIAHCLPEEKHTLRRHPAGEAARILIGPEGDFTPMEIRLALGAGFSPVTLGTTRLRTETAAVTAVALLKDAICA